MGDQPRQGSLSCTERQLCDAHALSSDCKQHLFAPAPGQYSKHEQVQTTLAAAQHIMLVTLKLAGM